MAHQQQKPPEKLAAQKHAEAPAEKKSSSSPPPKAHSHQQHLSAYSLLFGSATAAGLEILIFHPVDTIAKRLMSHQQRLIVWGSIYKNVSAVAFRDAKSASTFGKWVSLFPGVGFATVYKLFQRVYKFGGQPLINKAVEKPLAERQIKVSKPVLNCVTGAIIGIGEVVLLPVDVLKIKRQTNPEAFAGRSTLSIIRTFGIRSLYRGAGWTACRNAPGSLALFGGSALTKEYLFGLKNYNDATFLQNTVASTVGAWMSIVVASPLDVIKTRIQNKNFDSKVSGTTVFMDLWREEGIGGFFKGLTPKSLVVGPKLVFSFTMAQYLSAKIDQRFFNPATKH